MINRYLVLTLHRDYLGLFDFLKDNPTKAFQKGDYFRFAYIEPLNQTLTPFKFSKIWLEVTDTEPTGWELVRDFPTAYAGQKLLDELLDLERHQLAKKRQGRGLSLTGWLLDAVCYGIGTKQETTLLVRAMFVTGYDYEQIIGVASNLVRRTELAGHCLQELNRLYEGVSH